MEVPKGFLSQSWSFISFLPFFVLLLVLGVVKAVIIGPVVTIIVFVGNSAVIIGMWTAHFIWTYYCVMKTKKIGIALKMVLLAFLPLPLTLWPVLGILGSLLVGMGYGVFAPLIATFEAVGEGVVNKLYHCFVDGFADTIIGACTLVRDFTDFCFHSYFSYMDDLSENIRHDETPIEIKLIKLPSCVLVCLLAIPVDVPMISFVALWKSPYMLVKGWQRLFEDLIGREGPFLETVCVPFAGLAILLWPLAVVGSVVAAFLCSFFLGLYAGVIVHQEDSFRMGLAYIISVISIFDEYTNDLLYLREGSWLPRPKYRKAQVAQEHIERNDDSRRSGIEDQRASFDSKGTKLASQRSWTMKEAIKQLRPIQIWDWLFRSCELNGRILLNEDLISVGDVEKCIRGGKCKKLSIKLPSWCILQCLLRSANSGSHGLLISDGVELTNFNWPKDRVLDWILGPLLVMKEQIRSLQLNAYEEACLKKLILTGKNEKPEDWDEDFPSTDHVRRAQLQAILRRVHQPRGLDFFTVILPLVIVDRHAVLKMTIIQDRIAICLASPEPRLHGIVANLSRVPSFRRRFTSLVKTLHRDAVLRAGAASMSASASLDDKDDSNSRKLSMSAQNSSGLDDHYDIV